MYHLIFYDDEPEYLARIEERTERLCRAMGYEAETAACLTEEALWRELQGEEAGIRILFLDICIREKRRGGIELAEEINRRHPGSIIVFLTGYLDYVSDVYETEHCYYILKEELEKRLPVLFERILPERLAGNYETLRVRIGSRMEQVPQKKILYLERSLRKTRILLEDGSFLRCHNSFLASCRHIREMGRTEIRLSGGASVPVSRRYSPEARKAFARWGMRKVL